MPEVLEGDSRTEGKDPTGKSEKQVWEQMWQF